MPKATQKDLARSRLPPAARWRRGPRGRAGRPGREQAASRSSMERGTQGPCRETWPGAGCLPQLGRDGRQCSQQFPVLL